MREILFRAKAINRDPDAQYRTDYKNGDWVYGLISSDREYHDTHFTEMTNTDGVSGIDVDYKTICEYTGLTDKNGTKIFEGDIHENNGKKFILKYGSFYDSDRECSCYGWFFEDINNKEWREGLDGTENSYVNIIGNMHDNPELLERYNQ